METVTRNAVTQFDRMTFRYSYTTDSGKVINCQVKGECLTCVYSMDDELSEDDKLRAEVHAFTEWYKARAAYLEEAQEQELADRIARNRGEE
jgi:hypothetical protein